MTGAMWLIAAWGFSCGLVAGFGLGCIVQYRRQGEKEEAEMNAPLWYGLALAIGLLLYAAWVWSWW